MHDSQSLPKLYMETVVSEQNRIDPTEVGDDGQEVGPSERSLPVAWLGQTLSLTEGQTVGTKVVVLTYSPAAGILSEGTVGGTCVTQEAENSGLILVCPVNTKSSNNVISLLH